MEHGKLYWLSGPDEVKFRKTVDHDKFIYRLTAWPLPSSKELPMKFGVYVAPKRERSH